MRTLAVIGFLLLAGSTQAQDKIDTIYASGGTISWTKGVLTLTGAKVWLRADTVKVLDSTTYIVTNSAPSPVVAPVDPSRPYMVLSQDTIHGVVQGNIFVVQVKNISGGDLTWFATSNAGWVVNAGSPDWPLGSSAWLPGYYTMNRHGHRMATIMVYSNAQNSPVSLTVVQ